MFGIEEDEIVAAHEAAHVITAVAGGLGVGEIEFNLSRGNFGASGGMTIEDPQASSDGRHVAVAVAGSACDGLRRPVRDSSTGAIVPANMDTADDGMATRHAASAWGRDDPDNSPRIKAMQHEMLGVLNTPEFVQAIDQVRDKILELARSRADRSERSIAVGEVLPVAQAVTTDAMKKSLRDAIERVKAKFPIQPA